MNDETKYFILMPSIVKCFQNQCKTVQSHSSKSVVEENLPHILVDINISTLFSQFMWFCLPDFLAKQQQFAKIILADLSHLSHLIYLDKFIAIKFIVFLSCDKACHVYSTV